MTIKYSTTRECAEMLKGADSNCGSSLDSLARSGMSGYASALAANREKPVESYLEGTIHLSPGVESAARQRGLGIEAIVIMHFYHNCVIRQKTLRKWVGQIKVEVVE